MVPKNNRVIFPMEGDPVGAVDARFEDVVGRPLHLLGTEPRMTGIV